MKLDCPWQVRLAQGLLGEALVIGLVVVSGTNAQNDPVHTTTDWSHRHLIFSTPRTLFDRIQFASNARYVQQWVRRNAEHKREEEEEARRWHHAEDADPLHGDWSVYLGNVGTVGAGEYPAKFSFDVTTANCATAAQPDFVAWNTGLAGSGTAVAAFDTGA